MNCTHLGAIATTGASSIELPAEIRSGDLDGVLCSPKPLNADACETTLNIGAKEMQQHGTCKAGLSRGQESTTAPCGYITVYRASVRVVRILEPKAHSCLPPC